MSIFKKIGSWFNDITGVTSQQNRQEELANTAHQREVADLKNAGLNPVLSAGGTGSGNISTAGPSANPLEIAINTAKTISDIEKQDSERKNIDANTANIGQQMTWNPKIWTAGIELQNATTSKTRTEKEKIFVETAESETRTKALQIKNQMAGMDLEKRQKFWSDEMEIAKQQMITQATDAGFDNTTIGILLRSFGKVKDNMSPIVNTIPKTGNTYNFTTNSPTVNY